MQEGTNKAIAINSIILYVRLIIVSICSFFIARFSLQALGIVDYGLFSVVGGLIAFISIFNTIMLSTSNRFIAVAIGGGNIKEINEQFNVNLILHILIAVVTLVVVIIIGDWYILNYINYDGDISNALMVFRITVVGSIISFIGVPYNGLLMAKEKFIVFCLIDVVSSLLKLFLTYVLVWYFSNKLQIYSWMIVILTAAPTFVYILYCKRNYPEIVRFKFVRNKGKYRSVFSFSAWVAYGAFASVAKQQCAALLINAFYSTVMNTALGLANSVNSIINTFAHNVTKPISPQITKSYAAGDENRSLSLLIASSKMCFLLMLLVSAPFFVAPEWLFELWLGEVPPYVITFTLLLIVDALLDSLNSGISEMIFASGKIKLFQITINTLRLISILVAYFLLKFGLPAYSIQYAYIGFTIVALFVRQWILHRILGINNWLLFQKAYLPCILVSLLFAVVVIFVHNLHPVVAILLSLIALCVFDMYVGLSKPERIRIISYVKSRIKK